MHSQVAEGIASPSSLLYGLSAFPLSADGSSPDVVWMLNVQEKPRAQGSTIGREWHCQEVGSSGQGVFESLEVCPIMARLPGFPPSP